MKLGHSRLATHRINLRARRMTASKRKLSLFTSCVLAAAAQIGFAADPEIKQKYSPTPDDGFQQIIQRDDYPTIRFIEAIYAELSAIARPQSFKTTLDAELTDDAITFRVRGRPDRSLVLRRVRNAVAVGDRRFTHDEAVVLYTTLLRVLRDMGECRGARFTQFANSAYKRRTLIGFNFGRRIVEIDSLANGLHNDERLYVLDLVERPDSYLWGNVADRDGTD